MSFKVVPQLTSMMAISNWLNTKGGPYARAGNTTIVVKSCDEAIEWYTSKMLFEVISDETDPTVHSRMVVLRLKLPHALASNIVLTYLGDNAPQVDTNVELYLLSGNVANSYSLLRSKGVEFEAEPVDDGTKCEAVFKDKMGTKWTLLGNFASLEQDVPMAIQAEHDGQ